MEETFNFEVQASPTVVRDYLSDPKNLMVYVPHFKNLKEIDSNSWELKVSWLFSLSILVTREVSSNEITYFLKKTSGMFKILSYLRFNILPKKDNKVDVILTFYYKGPFESIAKNQAKKFYENGQKIFQQEIQKINNNQPIIVNNPRNIVTKVNESSSDIQILKMRTILAKEIEESELENIIEDSMVQSVGKTIVLILSDGENNVELKIKDGDLISQKGEIDKLHGKIKVIIKE
ncbi:DUF3211 domain-containing protein [Acidianus sulfidivorans JP7]|uniref:Polyketide cyclase n=1 Tax=Acidianus sulfidivorans JP7 TaxID=619593 RepID=A0A2U9ILM5_9CREN|nr:SRPBCC family protein [Acidianus sulfidivorans]AWR96958.1 DUF3211 domain-containing protein [Acidianus sulfidivorans JP7]